MRLAWLFTSSVVAGLGFLLLHGCGLDITGDAPPRDAGVDVVAPPPLPDGSISCIDGVKDGDETDIDCGGSCPNACASGRACKVPKDCQTGTCSNGKCAPASCGDGVKDGGETDVDCGGPQCGACPVGGVCVQPRDCTSATCMNGKCQPGGLGGACTKPGDCTSNHCVDGVCCNSDCPGQCMQCNLPSSNGMCTNAPPGTNPRSACVANVATCQAATCDGAGTCNVANGTTCSPPTCTGGKETDHTCMSGTCTAAPPLSCAPFKCNGTTCGGACASDGDCQAGAYCDENGKCQTQKAAGGACNTAAGGDCLQAGCRECGSNGGCVDGFCCDAMCTGACQACSTAAGASSNGHCTNLSGTPGRPSCTPLVCNGSGAGCPGGCNADTDCVAGDYCSNGGTCQPRKGNGQGCNTTTDCKVAGCRECDATNAGCVDSVCCNMACTGTCQACSTAAGAATNGQCGPVGLGAVCNTTYICTGGNNCPNSCNMDAECALTAFCFKDGTCHPQQGLNQPCDATDCKMVGCRECSTSGGCGGGGVCN